MDKNKKIKKSLKQDNINRKILNKRTLAFNVTIYSLLLALIFRLGFIQFVYGSRYKEEAYKQQTINQIISPKRGVVYDTNGKALAISADVDTITVNPTNIKYKNGSKVEPEKLAEKFCELFELEYESVLEKLNSDSNIETIIKKVEKDKITLLNDWIKENKIVTGINIDPDVKRYYPYGTLAAHLIGFCGTDSQGLEGLEANWDQVLTGTPGKIVTSASVIGQEIPNSEQTYIAAENGSNLVLTLDATIQSIAEKYLEQAVKENSCKRGGNVIIMSPETGDILAMATYPTYNLNTPFEPYQESLKNIWDTLDYEQKYEEWNKAWRNKATADGYEPGSTFKLITTSIALEEGLVKTDTRNEFICTGSEFVADTEIECWRPKYNPHGQQSLREALGNSCNPAFVQLGKRIGSKTFYKYFHAFGFFDRLNSGLASESAGYFHNENDVGPVELATMSFGQRFTITPLHLITAVSGIVNDGKLMQPRIVKELINSDTGAITTLAPTYVRQVISKETSEQMRDLMEYVVTSGTGGYAQVAGYSIGGKTGTSEPNPDKPEDGYVASYVAVAPTSKPKISVLVTLYDPKGSSHQGGQIAGPVVSQILSEVLPYMGLASTNSGETDSNNNNITLTDVRNRTVTEAKKILRASGFRVQSGNISNENEVLVTDQIPKPGQSLQEDSLIYLYTAENDVRVSTNVPNLKGMTLAQAINSLKSKNLNVSFTGSGKVISQSVSADTSVEVGSIVHITLQTELTDTH